MNNKLKSIFHGANKLSYGWVIVIATLIISCNLGGLRSVFGVFFKSLAFEFDLSRTETSSIYSIYMVLTAVFAVVIGWSLDRFGAKKTFGLMGLTAGLGLLITSQIHTFWQIYLSYSFLLGIGTSGTIVAVASAVSRWFRKNRGLAIGIATSGAGLGTVIIAPFAGFLITELGWRYSLIIIGVITIVVSLSLSALLRESPDKSSQQQSNTESNNSIKELTNSERSHQVVGITLLQAIKTRSYWMLFFAWILYASCVSLLTTHIVPYATDLGFTTIEASTVLSIAGIAMTLSRLSGGRISDMIGRKKPAAFYALLGAAALLTLIWSHQLWLLYLSAAIYGTFWGGFGINNLVIATDIFGSRHIGSIMGALDMGYSIGAALGSALGGIIFDSTGSYNLAFIIGSLFILVTIPMVTLTRCETDKALQ